MKTQSNLRKIIIDNSSENQARIKFICVVEEDLDFEPVDEHSAAVSAKLGEKSDQIKRYKYLCYLRSMDDMS